MQSNYYQAVFQQNQPYLMPNEIVQEEDSDESPIPDKRSGRRKIKIEYINDKSRRHITFSKRKAGIMKKAYELSTLTGTQVLLLVVSETGLVYTFTTPKLQPLVTKPEGKSLIQSCLNAPDPIEASSMDSSVTSPPMTHNTGYYPAEPSFTEDKKEYMVGTQQIASNYNPMTYPGYADNTAPYTYENNDRYWTNTSNMNSLKR